MTEEATKVMQKIINNKKRGEEMKSVFDRTIERMGSREVGAKLGAHERSEIVEALKRGQELEVANCKLATEIKALQKDLVQTTANYGSQRFRANNLASGLKDAEAKLERMSSLINYLSYMNDDEV